MVAGEVIGKIKNFMGFGFNDEEIEDVYEETEYIEPETKKKSASNSKVVPLGGSNNSVKPVIAVVKPKCFDESVNVTHELKKRHYVVLNVKDLGSDVARRVVDFVSGTVYGIDGDFKKVSEGIFVAAPSHVDINGDLLSGEENAEDGWNVISAY